MQYMQNKMIFLNDMYCFFFFFLIVLHLFGILEIILYLCIENKMFYLLER